MYDEMIYQQGDNNFVRLNSELLHSFLEKGLSRVPKESSAATKKSQYDHIILCLTLAHPIITIVPKRFDHAVKYSILALSELITHTVLFLAQRLAMPITFGRFWPKGFFDEETKLSMRDHGWCPSDIARAQSRYTSIQTSYIVRMMDKSLPGKDHSKCNDSVCQLYQIKMGEFRVGHQYDGCSCQQLEGTYS